MYLRKLPSFHILRFSSEAFDSGYNGSYNLAGRSRGVHVTQRLCILYIIYCFYFEYEQCANDDYPRLRDYRRSRLCWGFSLASLAERWARQMRK